MAGWLHGCKVKYAWVCLLATLWLLPFTLLQPLPVYTSSLHNLPCSAAAMIRRYGFTLSLFVTTRHGQASHRTA